MDLRNLSVLSAFLINLVLALVIHFRSARSKANIFFELTVYAISGWCLAMVLYRAAGAEAAEFWARVLYFFPTFIPTGFLLFGLYFPNYSVKKSITYPIVLSNALMAFLALYPGSVIEAVLLPSRGEKIIIFGWAYYLLYIFYIPGFFIASYYILAKKYLKATPFIKAQIHYIVLGLTAAANTAMITNLILPTIGFFELNWVGQIFTFIWVGGVAYAIGKHRLMDIRLVVARAVAYTLLVAILASFYTAGLFLGGRFLIGVVTPKEELYTSTVLALLIAFSFQPLRRFLEKATDNVFFKDRYDAQALLSRLSHIMASTLLLEDLVAKFLNELLSQMKISYGFTVLLKNSSIIWAKGEGQKTHPEFDEEEINFLINSTIKKNEERLLVFEELTESKTKRIMRENNLSIFLPLIVEKKVIGVLLLGEKSSGDIYSSEDINVLKITAPEIAVAVRNAQSFEEIKRFTVTLKEEVERATEKLRSANKRLKELDKLKDEFVSVASHELRTPMTAIKSYLWLALYKSEIPLKGKLKRNLERAYASTERLIKLVQEMLTISRIEGKRLELKLEKFNLYLLTKQVYEELKIKADEKKIKFSLPAEGVDLLVKADKDRIREVLQNIIGNALKFTPKNGRVKITFRKKNGMIETSVSDTGPGILKEDLPNLFQKFGKISHSYTKTKEPSGTGLGLYIAKQIIALHHGKIWVSSKKGEGSTFTFSLLEER